MINPDGDLFALVLIDANGRENYHATGALEDFWSSPEHIVSVGLAHGIHDWRYKPIDYVRAEIRRRPMAPWETVAVYIHPMVCAAKYRGHDYAVAPGAYFGGAYCRRCGSRRDDS